MMTKNNTVIKILGDSIAAGAGSSLFHKTNQLIIEDAGNQYLRCEAKNSWWGLLESYLEQRGIKCMVKNNGCCGAFSYQIYEHLDELVDREDEITIYSCCQDLDKGIYYYTTYECRDIKSLCFDAVELNGDKLYIRDIRRI